jgi:hypothetical protein
MRWTRNVARMEEKLAYFRGFQQENLEKFEISEHLSVHGAIILKYNLK